MRSVRFILRAIRYVHLVFWGGVAVMLAVMFIWRVPLLCLGILLLVAGWAALNVTVFRRAQQYRSRAAGGLCLYCGYDLRENRDRCPECGREIEWWVYASLGSRTTRATRLRMRRATSPPPEQ